jgi:tetratricopeptide (TPR) repeat protein
MNAPAEAAHDAARARLRDALALHAAERIDEALMAAEDALALDPALATAHAYIGNTLVTRKRAFGDGIAALERAAALAPDDAAIWFTLGWCQEYAANALGRPKGRTRPREEARGLDAATLYEAAKRTMLHARTLHPDEALLGDIEDILDVIAKETGVPWDTEEADAAPAAG